MKYRSRIDWWALLIIFGVSVIVNALQIFRVIRDEGVGITTSVLLIIIFGMLLLAVLNTRYILKENELYIRQGFFKLRIDYKSIVSVNAGRHFWGKLWGFSHYNLEIRYDNGKKYFGKIYISPVNQTEFIEQLNKCRGADNL